MNATVNVDCPTCGEHLLVPVKVVSAAQSTTPGHALVTIEPDPEFLAAHEATHDQSIVTLDNIAPTLLPPTRG